MSTLVAFSVAPAGGTGSYSDVVARVVRMVRESGVANETNAMFTNLEGEWDEVMDVVRRAVELCAEDGSRVSLVLKADVRPGAQDQLHGKVARVEERLA